MLKLLRKKKGIYFHNMGFSERLKPLIRIKQASADSEPAVDTVENDLARPDEGKTLADFPRLESHGRHDLSDRTINVVGNINPDDGEDWL